MTFANAKVLYEHLRKLGRTLDAKNLTKRYPELTDMKPTDSAEELVESSKKGKKK